MLVSRDNAITRAVPSGWPELPPGAMVTTRPGLLLRTMSGSMVIPQLRSLLKSVAHIATKGHMEHGV